MMPCKLCTPVDERGIPLSMGEPDSPKGLKQKGKTSYLPGGLVFERVYVCQDCGAKWKMKGSLASMTYKEIPMLEIVQG
jgi:hypothetical protein